MGQNNNLTIKENKADLLNFFENSNLFKRVDVSLDRVFIEMKRLKTLKESLNEIDLENGVTR